MPHSFGTVTCFRLAALLCLVTGFAGSLARADDLEALAKAKRAYQEASEKAFNGMLEAFASAIKAATASGNLDLVKALQAEKEAFETGGKVPTSARLKTAATTYQTSMKSATAALDKAMEQAVKELTKAGKLEQAAAVQAELKELRGSSKAVALKPGDVATKDDLQKYLGGTSWQWNNITLKTNGTVENKDWETRGVVTKWEAVDRRTVVLRIEKGRGDNLTAVLMFSEDLSEFRGYDFIGTDKFPPSKRKP